MNKKRIFAIVVFIILGLFMYTFANPLNDDTNEGKGNETTSNEQSNDNQNNSNNSQPLLDVNTDNTANRNNVRNAADNRTVATVTPVEQTATVTPATPAEQTAPVTPVEPVEPVTPAEPTNVDPVQPEQPVQPKPAIEDNPPIADLRMDKLNAIQELEDYRKDYTFEDTTEYEKVIQEYSEKINDSNTKKEITDNLTDGKKAIDELIIADLDAYREAAKKEIKDYADELELTTDVSELLNGYYNDIDNANTKSAIDQIVKDAKEALDKLKQQEIDKAKEDAINTINEYKKDDEKNISEIVNVKDEAKEDLDEVNDLEKIQEIVDKAKEDIDSIINNKKYTVTFYGLMNKVVKTETVAYKAAATTPKMNATQKGWNNSIEVEFLGWDTEADTLNAVTSDLEVRAQFKVLKATTKISILKEGLKNKDGSEKTISTDVKDFNHPYNRPEVEKDIYFNLNVNEEIEKAVNNYRGSHIFVYTDDNDTIRNVVEDEPSVYNNNKYKELQYYVLKLQGDRFHCDARVIYNYAAELADAKTAARNEITDYKTVETEDIDEIKTTKTEAINAIKDMTSVEDVKNKVQPTKDAIDTIIKNKTYDVTFVGKTTSQTVKVGYNKNAVAPTSEKFTNPVYRNVTYKLTGWDKSLNNIKANTTITASYEIEKVEATVFLIDEDNEDCNIPKDRSSNLAWECYKNFKTIEIKATKEIKEAIANDKKALVFDTDEAIRAVDKNSSLPTKDGKYKTYEFYVMKFIEDSFAGFHIDGKMFYDKETEELDKAKEELRKLIREAEAKSTEGKTDASIKKLNEDIKTAKEVVEGSNLNDINNSITTLSNIKLEDIEVLEVKVKDNKNGYYVQGQKLNLTVTYTDNNGHKDKETTNYEIHYVTPHRAYVTVDGVNSDVFEFTVVAKVVEEITKVVNNKDVYYQNDNLDITVTARFNDGEVRTLRQDEYTTDFTKKNPGKDIKGTVVATSNDTATKGFKYNVSKYNSKAEEESAIEAEAESNRISNIKKIDVKVDKNKNTYYVEFHKLPEGIEVTKVYREGRMLTIVAELGKPYIATNGKTRYDISHTDYGFLRETDTFLFSQYIYVEYKLDGKLYRAVYKEKKGNLTIQNVYRI